MGESERDSSPHNEDVDVMMCKKAEQGKCMFALNTNFHFPHPYPNFA